MDMTYVTIPIFNQTRRLYRESHMQYMVTSQDRSQNSPFYSVNTRLDSFILFNDENFSEPVTLSDLMTDREEEEDNVGVSEQFAEPVNSSKQNIGLELQIMCPFLLNIESQESSPQPNKNSEELEQVQQTVLTLLHYLLPPLYLSLNQTRSLVH